MRFMFGTLLKNLLSALAILGIGCNYAGAAEARPETRLYSFSQCPATSQDVFAEPALEAMVAPIAAMALSAIVSPLIEAVVDKGVAVLKEAAQDKDIHVAAPSPVIKDFYEVGVSGETVLNSSLGCIALVRGIFEEGNYPENVVSRGTTLTDRIAAKFRVQTGTRNGDPVIRLKPGTIEFYFEVVPVMSDNGKVFGLRPQALHVASFASKNSFFGSSKRSYKITITFSDPFGSETFASAEFQYEGIEAPFSVDTCVEKTASEFCPAIEMGGIRGWFATKPISEDLQAVIKPRQTSALTVTTAITPWVEPKPRSRIADDIESVRLKQDAYCAALETANKSKAAVMQQWDANCPGALMQAKREYLYEHVKVATRLEKDAADAFWKTNCVDSSKNELTKNKGNAVTCLRAIAGERERVAAGKFLLTSTIVETRPGSAVAKFLAPAAGKVTPTIKTALKQRLDPLERAKAMEAANAKSVNDAKVRRDALRRVTLADSEAQIAQMQYDLVMAELANMPQNAKVQIESIQAHMALLKAQSLANDAYRAADLPIPYPGVD